MKNRPLTAPTTAETTALKAGAVAMAIVGAAWHVAEHADPACVAFTETLRLVGIVVGKN